MNGREYRYFGFGSDISLFEGVLTISGFSADVSPVKSNTTSKPSPLPFKSDPFHALGGVNISR